MLNLQQAEHKITITVYKDKIIYIYIYKLKGLCNLTLQNVGYQ